MRIVCRGHVYAVWWAWGARRRFGGVLFPGRPELCADDAIAGLVGPARLVTSAVRARWAGWLLSGRLLGVVECLGQLEVDGGERGQDGAEGGGDVL